MDLNFFREHPTICTNRILRHHVPRCSRVIMALTSVASSNSNVSRPLFITVDRVFLKINITYFVADYIEACIHRDG